MKHKKKTNSNMNINDLLQYVNERSLKQSHRPYFEGFDHKQDEGLKLAMFYFEVDPNEIMVTFSDETLDLIKYRVKRPVYSVRGKTLSKEDTVFLLSRTDEFFHGDGISSIRHMLEKRYDIMTDKTLNWDDITLDKVLAWDGEEREILSTVDCDYFKNKWLKDFQDPCNHRTGAIAPTELSEPGWLRPDGAVSEDSYFVLRYPTLIELLEPWILISAFYDKLELVIALTGQNEMLDDPKGLPFQAYITHGIYIKGKHIRLMNAEQTIEAYRQFDPDKLESTEHIINTDYDWDEGEREALIEVCELARIQYELDHPGNPRYFPKREARYFMRERGFTEDDIRELYGLPDDMELNLGEDN